MRVNLIVVMNQAGSCRITAPDAGADTADAWWRQTSGIGISCFAMAAISGKPFKLWWRAMIRRNSDSGGFGMTTSAKTEFSKRPNLADVGINQ